MIREALTKLSDRLHLTEAEAEAAMLDIMGGGVTPAQIAAYLMGLRVKGEMVEEILGSVRAMRARATRIVVSDPLVVDTCGTGGDGAHTFNISTTAAFVVAGAGVTVAKHGNRSVSSRCGSADVLSALGVKVDLPPERVADCINEVGIGFLLAPYFHPAMKACAEPRREMGVRTLLNVMGPLTNPAGATGQVIGVYEPRLTDLLARVLVRLGTGRCFVVHGLDALDEVTLTDRTLVAEGQDGGVSTYTLDPADFGLEWQSAKDLSGGSPTENAFITREVLQRRPGPRRDIVCMNAALALIVGGKAKTLQEGFALAVHTIESGAAMHKLEQFIAVTHR